MAKFTRKVIPYAGQPSAALSDITNCGVQTMHAKSPEYVPSSVLPRETYPLADCSLSEITSGSTTPTEGSPRLSLDVSRSSEGSRVPGSPRQRAREAMADLGIECSWDESDQFYMYTYKVMTCPKKFSHEWSACPFAHKGERATRRDPRQVTYSATSCPDFKTGCCQRQDTCLFSHGVFEACLHPERYRTQLCNSGGNCKRSVCFFAHSLEELRTAAPTPQTCQPLPQQQQQPQLAPAMPQNQSALVQQLLGMPSVPDQAQHDMSMLMTPPQAPQASSDPILMAQLLACQQALGTLSSMLNTNQQQPQNTVANLLAQVQQQAAISALMPPQQLQQLQQPSMPGAWPYTAMAADPVVQLPNSRRQSVTSTPPNQIASFSKNPDSLAQYLDSQLRIADLSPRTPFDVDSSVSEDLSHQSHETSFSLDSPRETHATKEAYHAYAQSVNSNNTVGRPEDHLPSTLIDSIW